MDAPTVTNVTGFWFKKLLLPLTLLVLYATMMGLPFFFFPLLPSPGPRQDQYENYMGISCTCTNSSRFMSGKGDFNLSACSNSNMTLRVK